MRARDQIRVDLVVGATEPHRAVAAVQLGLFLFHDIGLDRNPEVIGLAGQVGGGVVVLSTGVEGGLAQVAPQHGHHAQLVGHPEGLRRLLELAHSLAGSEVDRRAHRHRPQLPRLLDAGEHHLVVAVGIGEQFVVVQLDQEGDSVGVAARHGAQHAQRGRDRVASALHGQFADVPGIEVDGIRGEGRPGRVFDPLVDGQDGDVAAAAEPPVAEDLLHAAHHLRVSVGTRHHPVDEVGAGEVKPVFREARGAIGQQVVGFGSEEVVDSVGCGHGGMGGRWSMGTAARRTRPRRCLCPLVCVRAASVSSGRAGQGRKGVVCRENPPQLPN